MKKEHRFLMPVLLSLLLTAAEVFLVVLLIRNLGSVILAAAGDETFAHIFGQLSSARIVPPFFLPFGLWLAFLLYAYRREYCAPRVILLAIPLGLILFVYTLFFANVNGVWFGSVIVSLLRYASHGLFDVL